MEDSDSGEEFLVLSYLSPPRKIRVRVRAIRAVRVAIALRIPLKTIARVYTHFTARSHNRRYCYDSPNNFWGVINRKVPNCFVQCCFWLEYLDNDVYPERGTCGFVIFSKIEKSRVTTIICFPRVL